jgi:uncharacterized protein (TIGR03790 family)
MKTSFPVLTLLAFLSSGVRLWAADEGSQVAVIYNSRVPDSKEIAGHYAQMRHVPASQIFGFPMSEAEEISRADFRETIQNPLALALANHDLLRFSSHAIPASNGVPEHLGQKVTFAKIRYLVLCYGVPLRIGEDHSLIEPSAESLQPELRRNEAAVDSELACLPILGKDFRLSGPYENRLYACTNANQLNPTNDVLIVARLDGPTPAIARNLVDKAIQAEKDGLWGRAYFDLRGLTNGTYKYGDDIIREAADFCRRFGFETIVDTNAATFPVSFPMSQIAYYAGWYNEHVSGPFTRPSVEFMPGAFAYHLHSFSAASLRTTDRQWVGPFLAKGVTATMGCVAEPYLGGTPDVGVFTARFLLSGFSFGEAAIAAQPVLSWQTTVVGDPLYRPFTRNSMELHKNLERRHSDLIAWFYLRVINLKLVQGMSLATASGILENLDETSRSPVLQEKLADLYTRQGKPSASIHALQQALKLNPSPQQRVRLMLTLADQLTAANRLADACAVYRQFLKDCPDYPDLASIQQQLDDLTQKLGNNPAPPKPNRVSSPPLNNPPLRHGI